MKIWKNTSTLYGYDEGLTFTKNKSQAKIALLGSKPINLVEFPNLKGIFRAGIGRDNVPENEAIKRGIIVKYPSKKTTDIIYDETASFTCGLIFRMLYNEVGSIEPWIKYDRSAISEKNLMDFIEKIEGPLGLVDCNIDSECSLIDLCVIRKPINSINKNVRDLFQNISLLEILN